MNQVDGNLTKGQLLSLLNRKTSWNSWRETCNRDVVDLSGTDISGRDLTSYDLRRVDFTGCTALGTCFAHADLYLAKLTQASCTNADFSGSIMINVSADRADFCGSNFTSTVAHGVDATNTSFIGCKMMNANLLNMKAPYGQFRGALLVSAEMCGCDLSHADLMDAELDGANLNQAQLRLTKIQAKQLAGTANWYLTKGNIELIMETFQYIRSKIIDTHIPNLPNR